MGAGEVSKLTDGCEPNPLPKRVMISPGAMAPVTGMKGPPAAGKEEPPRNVAALTTDDNLGPAGCERSIFAAEPSELPPP